MKFGQDRDAEIKELKTRLAQLRISLQVARVLLIQCRNQLSAPEGFSGRERATLVTAIKAIEREVEP